MDNPVTSHSEGCDGKPRRRIILAGGSGFLGRVLARYFIKRGDEVIVLTRSPKARNDGAVDVLWDGRTLADWTKSFDGADALINLAGRTVNCRYNERNRREILGSRVDSTRVLGEAIAHCAQPPRVWLNSSTATIYRHSLDRPMDEATGEIGATLEAKDAFSVEVAMAWEKTFQAARTPATRKVILRSAMVMAPEENSVFPMLRRLTRVGLGGRMASGRQFVSWIHEQDFCRVIEWLIEREDISGIVNVAAPHPLPNREMMQTFRRICRAPVGLPAALWMLEAGAFFLRTETELIIKSRQVVPGRLLSLGFKFHFERMEDALAEIENRLGRCG